LFVNFPGTASGNTLGRFKRYIEERLKARVWNAVVLLRELRGQGYAGGYTTLKAWLPPLRASARVVAVRRFETPPGRQSQVDWGHLGTHVSSLQHEASRQQWRGDVQLGVRLLVRGCCGIPWRFSR
jgi:transposase